MTDQTTLRLEAAQQRLSGVFMRRWHLILLLAIVLFGVTGGMNTQHMPVNTLPILGGGGESELESAGGFVLDIPEIGVSHAVQEAYVRGDTWDFSVFRQEVAHLELTAYPGQGSNVVIGAHYELANFVPGPFIALDQLVIGDQITVQYEERTYVYEVNDILQVHPSEVYVAYPTPQETLTLLTCYSYNGQGTYARRYVVRANLVEVL